MFDADAVDDDRELPATTTAYYLYDRAASVLAINKFYGIAYGVLPSADTGDITAVRTADVTPATPEADHGSS